MTLQAHGISVKLGGKQVLGEVTCAFQPGRVTAVIGPNGAGKSTLLQCLAALRVPDDGHVTLGERNIRGIHPRERAQKIAYVPQHTDIAWAVDVRTFVGLGRIPFVGAFGLSQSDTVAVDAALARTMTMALEARDVLTLSGGERARLLLARALAGEPQWLLADEPLTGLDPGYQVDVAQLLRTMAHDAGLGVVVTLHDLHMAHRLADAVIVLAEGGVLASGMPSESLSAPMLERAYGVKVHVSQGPHGPVIDIIGRP